MEKINLNNNWKEECGWSKMSESERINFLIEHDMYDVDVFDDPPTLPLNKMDYLRKNPINKFKTFIANMLAKSYINKLIKKSELIIDEIKGIENLKAIDTGAIITCNHFSPFDNFAVQKVFEGVQKKGQKMWKIIREGNYTNPPCLKFFFKNCDTLPLSSNIHVMGDFLKAIKTLLNKGDFILIYPEESLWPNYKKPKPLKDGAFKLAVRNSVPVIPIFITFKDSGNFDKNGQAIQKYTVHVCPPIYPKENLKAKENIEYLKSENSKVWKEIYEVAYGEKLSCSQN